MSNFAGQWRIEHVSFVIPLCFTILHCKSYVEIYFEKLELVDGFGPQNSFEKNFTNLWKSGCAQGWANSRRKA